MFHFNITHLRVLLQGLSEVESMVRALQLVSVLVEVRGRCLHTIHTGYDPAAGVSAGGGEGKQPIPLTKVCVHSHPFLPSPLPPPQVMGDRILPHLGIIASALPCIWATASSHLATPRCGRGRGAGREFCIRVGRKGLVHSVKRGGAGFGVPGIPGTVFSALCPLLPIPPSLS